MTSTMEAGLHKRMGQLDFVGACGHACWLVDPMLADPRRQIPELDRLQAEVIAVDHPAMPKAKRPLLLWADDKDQLLKTMGEVFRFAQQECLSPLPPGMPRPRSVCAFMATDLRPDDLAAMLARASLVLDASRTRRILRLWDPRVVQHYQRDELAPQLIPAGFVGRWTYLDAHGGLQQVIRDAVLPTRPLFNRPLSDAQQDWLRDVSDMNAVFEHAFHAAPAHANARWLHIGESLQVARSLQLPRQDDVICFAALRVAAGLPIEHSPRMRRLLADAAQLAMPLAALRANLSDVDWELIHGEASAPSLARSDTAQGR